MTDDRIMREVETPILFGLEAQGHIPTIERMLADGESWHAIGLEIGWHAATACSHYERYQARRAAIMGAKEAGDE